MRRRRAFRQAGFGAGVAPRCPGHSQLTVAATALPKGSWGPGRYVCANCHFSAHMQKVLFSFFLAALWCHPGHAQTTPSPAAAAPAELSAGRRDTLAAIGKMYARRRAGAKSWGYVGAGGLLALVRVATAGSSTGSSTGSSYGAPSTSSSANGGAIAVVGGVFVGIPAIIAISKLVRFSEEHEQEVDRAYRSGQPLPAAVGRQLNKKDFQ